MRRTARGVPPARRTGQAEIERLVSFTDAVVAIAITLLVLGLKVPSGLTEEEFTAALSALGPQLFSFVLSFLVIGQFWLSHHRMFRHVSYYDDRLLVLNGAFLLAIVFLPFPTALVGQYMHYPLALVLYAVSISITGMLFSLLWVHIAYSAHLVSDDVDPRFRRFLLMGTLAVPGTFLASIPLAVAGPDHAAAAAWFLVPPVIRAVIRSRYHHERPDKRSAPRRSHQTHRAL